ncbi:MAG: ATP-binding protein [Prolixibacteraceae bacterium]|nr:ATP-binding protein [Prolixibacteraceae bacterium]
MKPWYEVYDLISEALNRFIESSDAIKMNPGKALYNRFINDPQFVENNNWIKKFDEKFNVRSVDPMHIFASISANNLTFKSRTARINKILETLSSEPISGEINFDGCPSLALIHILSARNETSQVEVWELFNRIRSNNTKGLLKKDFDRIKSWYGVAFGSFTILLFWIKSDCFIPFDKNTRTFLISGGIIDQEPRSYGSYIKLIERIEKYNYENDPIYGSSGIFREISLIAYQTIAKNDKDVKLTINFQKLLEEDNDKNLVEKGKKEPSDDQKSRPAFKLKNESKERLKSLAEGASLGFKLVAIRPLEGCKQEFLNVLKANVVYNFDKSIFIDSDDIVYFSDKNLKLYDLKIKSERALRINLSAIVGKNGSGKSSLIELFFRIVNNIAFSRKTTLQTGKLQLIKGLSVELYYTQGGLLYKLIVIDSEVTIQTFELHENKYFRPVGIPRKFLKQDFNIFFYTVAVNYSHYALNSIYIGDWARMLFHKNDAYQTPLVVNPMRTDGNININSENALVKSRLLANLIAPIADEEDIGLRQLTENQKVIKITFEQINDKNRVLFYRNTNEDDDVEVLGNALKTNYSDIYNLIKEVFEFSPDHTDENNNLVNESKRYIVKKLVRISLTYKHYSKYFNQYKIDFISTKSLKEYLSLLKEDRSHIVYKLKQAINYWKYSELWPRANKFELHIEDAADKLQKFQMETGEKQIIELLPPPIFRFEITLIDSLKNESDFNSLSSGEKQLIYSTASILYHLKNLDSVAGERGLIKYDCINLILDEIELYYHPELQRRFVGYLLSMIGKIDFEYITALNICLVTHSPYILSDIPDTYTLRLEDGRPSKMEYKTFGANIHDLLANEFFMKNGYMGAFAKDKIKEVIKYLETKLKDRLNSKSLEQKTDEFIWDKNSVKIFIDFVGEPLIRNSLLDLYDKVFFNNQEQIDFEIARLLKRKEQLN